MASLKKVNKNKDEDAFEISSNPMTNMGVDETGHSLKNDCFSPFKYNVVPDLERVGVPGHKLFEHDISVLRLWKGTSFQQVLTSGLFKAYLAFLGLMMLIFSQVNYNDSMRATNLDPSLKSSINTLCIFTITFFMSSTVSKVNTRFENVCKTNGFVTRLSALAGALYPYDEAKALMRYTNSILHIYYFLMSGPMNDEKWGKMLARGLLTGEEIEKLKLQGNPGVIIYCWALHILKYCGEVSDYKVQKGSQETMEQALTAANNWATGMTPFQLNMETCIGGTRGLAAKQIAYSLFQTPLLYFHSVYVSVNIYLVCTCYDVGHSFARGLNEPCHLIAQHPEPGHLSDDGADLNGTCYSSCITSVLAQIVLLIVFLSILKAAEKLSDAYGPKAYHYDLGVDLDGLWKESQNVLKSMKVPLPKYK